MNPILIVFIGVVALIVICVIGISIYNKSRGTITVILDKYQFARGEKVTGKVVVALKKTIHAQKLTVSLSAVKEIMQHNVNMGMPSSTPGVSNQNMTTRETLFQFEMPLDGEKDYLQQEYPFSIDIPQDAALGGSNTSPTGVMAAVAIGEVMTRLNSSVPMTTVNSRTTWSVRSQLYIPGKLDLSGTTQINVT